LSAQGSVQTALLLRRVIFIASVSLVTLLLNHNEAELRLAHTEGPITERKPTSETPGANGMGAHSGGLLEKTGLVGNLAQHMENMNVEGYDEQPDTAVQGNSSVASLTGTKKYVVKQSIARAIRSQQRTKISGKTNLAEPYTGQTRSKVNFTLRPLELRDVGACFHLGDRIFSETKFNNLYRTWDEFEVVNLINSHPEFCFIAETVEDDEISQPNLTNKTLAGFALGSVLIKKNGKFCIGYLDWVVVEPRFQCQGIGTALIKRVIDALRDEYQVKILIADTPAGNKPAINFFTQRIGLTEMVPHVYMSRKVFPETSLTGNGNVTVRRMRVHDLHTVHSLGEVLFEKFPNLIRNWDQHAVMSQFQTDREFSLVAISDGRLAGFALGTYIEKPLQKIKIGHLTWLGVHPDYSRRGIGRRLVIEFESLVREEGCQQLLVDTEADNGPAIALFNKLNFSHIEKHVYFSKSVT